MSDWTLKLNAVAAGVVVAFGFTMGWNPVPASWGGRAPPGGPPQERRGEEGGGASRTPPTGVIAGPHPRRSAARLLSRPFPFPRAPPARPAAKPPRPDPSPRAANARDPARGAGWQGSDPVFRSVEDACASFQLVRGSPTWSRRSRLVPLWCH